MIVLGDEQNRWVVEVDTVEGVTAVAAASFGGLRSPSTRHWHAIQPVLSPWIKTLPPCSISSGSSPVFRRRCDEW